MRTWLPGVKAGRRGQTAIEYLLVTVSLLFVFVMMYKALQYAVSNQFKRGGMVIMKVYQESPF
ncbi:MAG TPA: hypothetical protein DCZ92_01705 [Elusimicrobia bacterium]|nr:MAG: hypothetical protein A2016_04005 [Elusimicrobia bacterium GWF2_62_30]HBA59542.1 hypothetical protein [Elusimicrobiota bacterium]